MESDGFHYTDVQWTEIAKHVEAAGGEKARQTLKAKRRDLQERVAKYKDRIERWTGVGYDGEDLRPRYKQIAKASADLKAAVSEVNFEDSEWWGWITDAEDERVVNFKSTLDYVRRTAQGQARMRVRVNMQRDFFFYYLARFWEEELSLTWTHSETSHMVRFIAAACAGVYDFPKHRTPESTISGALRPFRSPKQV